MTTGRYFLLLLSAFGRMPMVNTGQALT